MSCLVGFFNVFRRIVLVCVVWLITYTPTIGVLALWIGHECIWSRCLWISTFDISRSMWTETVWRWERREGGDSRNGVFCRCQQHWGIYSALPRCCSPELSLYTTLRLHNHFSCMDPPLPHTTTSLPKYLAQLIFTTVHLKSAMRLLPSKQ